MKQGQAYNGMYFLIQGEVKVILNGQLHIRQYEDSKPIDEYEKSIAGNMTDTSLLGHNEVMRALSQPHVHVSSHNYIMSVIMINNTTKASPLDCEVFLLYMVIF